MFHIFLTKDNIFFLCFYFYLSFIYNQLTECRYLVLATQILNKLICIGFLRFVKTIQLSEMLLFLGVVQYMYLPYVLIEFLCVHLLKPHLISIYFACSINMLSLMF